MLKRNGVSASSALFHSLCIAVHSSLGHEPIHDPTGHVCFGSIPNFFPPRMAKMITLEISRRIQLKACGVAAACSLLAASLGAQNTSPGIAPRISSDISNAEPSAIPGSATPMAQSPFDTGRLSAGTRLNSMTIVFNRTADQEAALKALIAAQQDPASPYYHQWLTPDQFADRFGMAESDIATVESWLQQQGFTIDSVARSRNAIHFSGSSAQVERAFQTEMHSYKVSGVSHFAPSKELSLPAAIASAVLGVRNVDDFRPLPHVFFKKSGRLNPSFTSAGNSNIFFAPPDIVTAYDIKPVYSAGYTGSGQSITLVGQSAIVMGDIEAFQTASGLAVKDPSLYLVPGSGSSAKSDGDEAESDLDLEWSGAIATGATINFVYAGNNPNYGAFDALQYAIDQQIGTIISSSYGTCETALGGATLEASFEQAATQGQTILSASGDSGSTDCSGIPGLSSSIQKGVAVDYPASSPFVTGLGGTEISSTADSGNYVTVGAGFWQADSGSTDLVNSVLKYIPEVVWNDDALSVQFGGTLSAGGGGASALFPKPTWQAGVPGIPTDSKRDVPDLSLYASPYWPGYLFCSSDSGTNGPWQNGQVSSCTSGFADSSTGDYIVAGGTSFSAPIFAGMLALINQKGGYTSGQGLINPTLYTLASNGSTYASAFHDITSGNNNCLGGSTYCSSATGFSAGVGYDQASGLGSVDVANLATAWPASSGPTLISTTTTISASSTSPLVDVVDNFTITISAASGTITGSVNITLDSNPPISEPLSSNGTYVYSKSFATAGVHTILVSYPGDSTYAASSASVSITVGVSSSGSGSFTLASTPATLTVAQGSTGTETINVTPKGGYTGTVDLTFDAGTSGDNALQNLCYQFTNTNTAGVGTVAVSGTAVTSTQLLLDTNAADCGIGATGGMRPMSTLTHRSTASITGQKSAPLPSRIPAPLPVAFAGLVLAGFLGRRSRRLRGLACLIVLGAMGLALSACNNTNGSLSVSDPPKGTYTITVTGQDSATSTITGTSTFSFVIN
jgi:hypothetical protein